MYYLQSRYYDPVIGRFINADKYTTTGQGFIGFNMFVYCNNNPIMCTDPCGTCIHYWFLFGIIDCEDCQKGPTWIDKYRNIDGSYSITDNKRNDPNRLYHEQTMVLSASGTSIDLPDGDCTLGGVDFTLLTGGWEFDTWDLSLFDIGRAQAGLGFEDNTFYASAIVSIWSPSVTWSMFGLNFSVSAHVGSVGKELKFGKDGFKIGAASAWGASISVSWD